MGNQCRWWHAPRVFGKRWRMMVVDLDVHQGNGLGRDKLKLHSDDDVFILDSFNPYIYSNDQYAASAINRIVHVTPKSTDRSYLADIDEALGESLSQFKPDILFYNAGTDILVGDPLNGGVRITAEGIRARDALVFRHAFEHNVPIVMVLSGGYARDNAAVVGASLIHLFRTFDLLGKARSVASS